MRIFAWIQIRIVLLLLLSPLQLWAEELTLENLEKRHTEIILNEQKQRALTREVMQANLDPDEMVKGLKVTIQNLNSRDQELLLTGKWSEMSERARQNLVQNWSQWSQAMELFQEQQKLVDWMNIHKNEYIVDELFYATEEIHTNIGKNNKYLIRQYEELKALREQLKAESVLYGTPKDTQRLKTLRKYYSISRSYFQDASIDVAKPLDRVLLRLKRLTKTPKRAYEFIKLAQLLPDAMMLMSDITFSGGGSIHQTLNKAFIKAAKALKLPVKIEGLENLDELKNPRPKKITIIAKVHRGPVLDNYILSHLRLRDYAFVTSVGSMIPKWWSDRLKDNPGIAFVGPGFPNGIETVRSKTIGNPEKIMVNYPEGSVGNFGETRPVTKKFFTDLIPAFYESGIEVSLIPVSSGASSFLKNDITTDQLFGRLIEAKVHEPLTQSVLHFFSHTDQVDQLPILLRQFWLSGMKVDQSMALIDGALTLDGMRAMTLDHHHTGNKTGAKFPCDTKEYLKYLNRLVFKPE